MKIVLVIVAIVLVAGAVLVFLRSRVVDNIPVQVGQIPAIVAQLKATGHDTSFVVFLFSPPGTSPQDDSQSVNLQFSIDKNRLGLDWVLLSPRNKADEARIAQFMKDQGFAVNKRLENGVSFLRVEDGDIVALGLKIVTQFYGLNRSDSIDMIVDGFDWKAGG